MMVEKDTSYRISSYIRTFVLIALTILFIFPILLVLMNSFKSRLYVSTIPFALPLGDMFVGLENYINGLTTSGFFKASHKIEDLLVKKRSIVYNGINNYLSGRCLLRRSQIFSTAAACPFPLRYSLPKRKQALTASRKLPKRSHPSSRLL